MNTQLSLFEQNQQPSQTETIMSNSSKKTLLQTLLLRTLADNEDPDSILRHYIKTIVPAMEKEFSSTYAMGGNEEDHYRRLVPKHGVEKAREIAMQRANKADQSLFVHVLNALFIGWRLSKYLPPKIQLTDVEKKLFCLGITLHDYGKQHYEKEQESPRAYQVREIIQACENLGEQLNFNEFWPEWKDYLTEIAFLAQNTQFKVGANSVPSNWEINGCRFLIDENRLDNLCHLLAFGDVSVHLSDPSDIIKLKAGNKKRSSGDALQDHIELLGISKKLVYHRLRDCRGILTNGIHNIMLDYAKTLDWIPLIFFAQGAVYLAPLDSQVPDLENLQKFIWKRIKIFLIDRMKSGEIGFKRDGKGLKISPQTLELFSASDLILTLPSVIKATVRNEKAATPKRLEKLDLDESEKDLFNYADLRSDRLAEFIILAQRELFSTIEDYPDFILQALDLEAKIPVEKTQIQSGGVNYGWYYVAAHYIANNGTWDEEQTQQAITELAEKLAEWAETNNLLPENNNPTREIFFDYLNQYLDVSDCQIKVPDFTQELSNYTLSKAKNKAICSLSGGEFIAEDQMDSVVIWKPQQYSNKNPLGGSRTKRGISKIWSLEMLLRQAQWTGRNNQVNKLEDQKPIFLYIFPAYVYSPETIRAVGRLIQGELIDINLWNVKKCWLDGNMKNEALQNLTWLEDDEENQESKLAKYSSIDLPFMATNYTKTRGKTDTDAWVKPAFLALALPQLLGVKVVATSSPDPLYASDQEFVETVKFDGVAGFWNLLGLSSNLRLQEIQPALTKLLIVYSLHLDNRSNPPDERWQALNSTVREVMTDVLNIFAIANEGLRNKKRDPYSEEVERYWQFAQIFSHGDSKMTEKLKKTKDLVNYSRTFYQVKLSDSSHSILLPISKALEIILSTPENIDNEDLIFQGAGQLHDALDRQEVYKRPLLQNKSIPYETRKNQELEAIYQFMRFCVEEVFCQMYKGDKALLQENRNRIKSGAEFAYRWLTLEEQKQEQVTSESIDS
ncbi:CRISPR-associated protein Csc3 [Gloeothece citriformis PCC 7424]|uniref:CRISPR-associated protein Csc3 n=1 Tax=Gloeothece citriformis (strain PCC 7424) TaxID=65393 RepID=B7KB38_GLOC7|nr:type I-D CRISPR-associated protein Cas10d/Csc3 [Gloeothece citriformis]ACK70148.1 CRISPR-associated protein Csc3 [Gloeothece citriformis PCC 7424]